jgi:hypothetical protein
VDPMDSSVERRLAGVIAEKVRDLPDPPPVLFETLTRGALRRRRLRRRRLRRLGSAGAAGAAGLALVATLSLAPLLPGARRGIGPAAPTRVPGVVPPTADRLPDFAAARPIAQVWPEAVVRLPDTVNGRYIRPHAILPGDRYLVTSPDGFDRMDVAVYDAAVRTLTPVTDAPRGAVIGIAGDRVVIAFPDLGRLREIATVPLHGGALTLLARPQAPAGTRVNVVSITRDAVFWSLTVDERVRPGVPSATGYRGLHRVPVTGGPVERITGGDGFTASWHLPGVVDTVQTWDTGPASGRVWDLDTGERAGYTRNPAMAEMVCATLDWCGGTSTARHPAVQRLDGGGFVELPGEGAVAPLPGGRFARITFTATHPIGPGARAITGSVFWDLRTGRVGAADNVGAGGHDGLTSYAVGGTFAMWEVDGGYVLLDVARVA